MGFTTLYAQDGQFVDVVGDTMTGQLQLDAGTSGAPGSSWADDPDTGWLWNSTGSTTYSANGTPTVTFDAAEATFSADVLVDNHKVGINPSGTANAYEALTIENGNFLQQSANEIQWFMKRVGTYGTAVNPVFKFGRIIADASSNLARIRMLYADDSTSEQPIWDIESEGTMALVHQNEKRSYYEGFNANGETVPEFRLNSSPRMGLEFGAGGSSQTDCGIRRRAANILTVDDGATQSDGCTLEMLEVSSAPAGSTNTARIFCEDNGSGKTRLMVQFQTGSAIQIAIEA